MTNGSDLAHFFHYRFSAMKKILNVSFTMTRPWIKAVKRNTKTNKTKTNLSFIKTVAVGRKIFIHTFK